MAARETKGERVNLCPPSKYLLGSAAKGPLAPPRDPPPLQPLGFCLGLLGATREAWQLRLRGALSPGGGLSPQPGFRLRAEGKGKQQQLPSCPGCKSRHLGKEEQRSETGLAGGTACHQGKPSGRWPRYFWEGQWVALPGWEEAASTLGGKGHPVRCAPSVTPLLLAFSPLPSSGPTCPLAPHGGSCSANPLQEALGHVGHQPWGRDGECCGRQVVGRLLGRPRRGCQSQKGSPGRGGLTHPAPRAQTPSPAPSADPPGAPLLPGPRGWHLGWGGGSGRAPAVMGPGTGTPPAKPPMLRFPHQPDGLLPWQRRGTGGYRCPVADLSFPPSPAPSALPRCPL